jgi:formylglycine-generating enzyme required for sulfatase activity
VARTRSSLLCAIIAVALAGSFVASAHAAPIALNMVTVGNPGNANDVTGFGAVPYEFRIMAYEWTNAEYVTFLNSVDPDGANPNAIYSPAMDADARGGISVASNAPSGAKYFSKPNMGNKPANYVSWFDAARVANWLHKGAQTYGATDSSAGAPQNQGAYAVGQATSGTAPARSPAALYWVPTESEWYKAAYYNGITGTYSTYGTGYSTQPAAIAANASGDGSAGNSGNFANYGHGGSWNGQYGNVTTVGTNGGPNYYGVYDMAGNLWEPNDLTGSASDVRGRRGGVWHDSQSFMLSSTRLEAPTTLEGDGNGFRLVSSVAVPEPSTSMMGAVGIACATWLAWRRRQTRRAFRGAVLAAAMLALATTGLAHAVTIDWVTVGDPGNADDTNGRGAVAGEYRIMKYEFTNAQYAMFLNAIDPAGTNPNSIYSSSMGDNARGGISFSSGNPAGTKYATRSNMGDKPVNFVSWWRMARVSNWLHNGAQSYGITDSSATAPQNTGAYPVGTATSGNAVARNPGALFYVPTENEWYKAAYYKGGSTNAGYWTYATQSDATPAAVTSGSTGIGSAGDTGNFANYNNGANWNDQGGNVTTVGTNGGPSYYGAFDMTGNVWEKNDLTGSGGPFLGVRGGSWNTSAFELSSSGGFPDTSSVGENFRDGFRLASPVPVPEPST